MFLRESTEADIPAIVELLKKTLGEISSPKTINYWIWKHIENPFGKSFVFVADGSSELIGVRAMMQWEWQMGHDKFKALRAVDTATHPDHQGKSVFSVLTMKLVDLANEKGINFIFNTPNSKSLPGYLKLGWTSSGKLAVGISMRFSLPVSLFNIHNSTVNLALLDNLCIRWNLLQQKTNQIFTPKSSAYLIWRYVNNPIIDYFVYSDATFFLAMYIRKRKNINELRVTELICCDSKKSDRNHVKSIVGKYAAEKRADIITFTPQIRNWMPGLKIILRIGPTFTTKKINVDLLSLSHAKMVYQLGDMELF